MKISFQKQPKEQTFKQLYEEFYAPFVLYAKRFIDDKETREDIVSDVFTSLWDKIDSFDFQSDTALGYIKMCVKNSCLNYLKHQEYEWNYAEVVQKKAPIYEVEPDSVYTLDELYRMLYETLNKLPESYRTVFIKSFFEGKTHAEIAEEMNLSVKSINRYKQKTMELLRNELKDYLPLFLLSNSSLLSSTTTYTFFPVSNALHLFAETLCLSMFTGEEQLFHLLLTHTIR